MRRIVPMLEPTENLCEFDRRRFPGALADLYDFLVLALDVGIPGRPGADVFQHFERLFVSPDGSEEPGRVGQEADEDGEDDGGHALECEQESPADRGPAFERVRAAGDEGEAKGDPVGDGDAEVVCLRSERRVSRSCGWKGQGY